VRRVPPSRGEPTLLHKVLFVIFIIIVLSWLF
jgi:hypothetical protein